MMTLNYLNFLTKFSDFIKENHKNIDPYSEENWSEKPVDPSNWKNGDIITCTNKAIGGGKRLIIGKKYEIFDILKPNGNAVMVVGDNNTYYSTRYFELKK